MLRLEEGPGRTDTVVDLVEEAVADLEDHEVVMVEVAAALWVQLLHPEIGDVVRGQMPMVVEVVAASEVEEAVTSGSLHGIGVLLTAYATDLH